MLQLYCNSVLLYCHTISSRLKGYHFVTTAYKYRVNILVLQGKFVYLFFSLIENIIKNLRSETLWIIWNMSQISPMPQITLT